MPEPTVSTGVGVGRKLTPVRFALIHCVLFGEEIDRVSSVVVGRELVCREW